MNKSLRWIQLACTCQGTCFSTFRKDIGISQSFQTFFSLFVLSFFGSKRSNSIPLLAKPQWWCCTTDTRKHSPQFNRAVKNEPTLAFYVSTSRMRFIPHSCTKTSVLSALKTGWLGWRLTCGRKCQSTDLTHHSWQRSMIVTKSRWSRTDPLH